MSCYRYTEHNIKFSEGADDTCCLCTFGINGRNVDLEQLRSLAYLGASVVLIESNQIDGKYIPHNLPEWVKTGIDSLISKCA